MKNLVLFISLIFIPCLIYSQQSSQKWELAGLDEANSITKEKLLNLEKLHTKSSDIQIKSFQIKTVDSQGYLHEFTLEQNKFTQDAKNWIKDKINTGKNFNFENIKANKNNQQINLEPKTLKVVEK